MNIAQRSALILIAICLSCRISVCAHDYTFLFVFRLTDEKKRQIALKETDSIIVEGDLGGEAYKWTGMGNNVLGTQIYEQKRFRYLTISFIYDGKKMVVHADVPATISFSKCFDDIMDLSIDVQFREGLFNKTFQNKHEPCLLSLEDE